MGIDWNGLLGPHDLPGERSHAARGDRGCPRSSPRSRPDGTATRRRADRTRSHWIPPGETVEGKKGQLLEVEQAADDLLADDLDLLVIAGGYGRVSTMRSCATISRWPPGTASTSTVSPGCPWPTSTPRDLQQAGSATSWNTMPSRRWYAGRMTRGGQHDVQLAVRMPSEVISELDALVPEVHPTRADAVRAAVQAYLYHLACERDAQRYANAPLDDVELALTDHPEAWSATPSW